MTRDQHDHVKRKDINKEKNGLAVSIPTGVSLAFSLVGTRARIKTLDLVRISNMVIWQGQKDSNPRHAVLETAALPTELYP